VLVISKREGLVEAKGGSRYTNLTMVALSMEFESWETSDVPLSIIEGVLYLTPDIPLLFSIYS